MSTWAMLSQKRNRVGINLPALVFVSLLAAAACLVIFSCYYSNLLLIDEMQQEEQEELKLVMHDRDKDNKKNSDGDRDTHGNRFDRATTNTSLFPFHHSSGSNIDHENVGIKLHNSKNQEELHVPPPEWSDFRCISLGDEMESILSHANQIFITMPAKAAGASMKAFVSNCVSSSHFGTSGGDGTIGGNTLAGGNSSWASEHDNFVDEGLEEMFLTSSFQLPRIVASHIKSDTVLINLMRHMTRRSLLIYLYRHEIDRLMSSLRWIAERRLCKRFWKGIDSNFTSFCGGKIQQVCDQ
jgi:hypothetical protein